MEERKDRLVIWGRNPVIEALRSGKSLEKIYIAHDSKPPYKLLELAKKRGVKVQKTPRYKIDEMAGTKKNQGVVALISPVEYVSPEELFKEAINKNSFFIVIDHITDPQNVGNLLRTCEVLGGVGALIPKDRTSPINETVVKTSSGAVFYLKLSKVPSLSRALREFKRMGGWIYAVEKGGEDIRNTAVNRPCALVLGAEDKGVSQSVLEISDKVITIPMKGKVGSLNVSSAGAIAMWKVASDML